MRRFLVVVVLSAALAAACGGPESDSPRESAFPEAGSALTAAERQSLEAETREILERQTAAWNEGDLVTFVGDYLDSPRMRFVSGNSIRMGTEDLLERYRTNYPDRAAMGRLHFSDLDIRVLSPEFVFVFGRYNLEREADAPTGLFTLLFERTPEGLRIAHDHTSS